MINQIEENDRGFTSFWSKTINLECGILFANEKLPNDVFFNKLVSVTCTSMSMLDEAIEIFRQHKTLPFIYSLNYPQLEEVLRKKNFIYYDTQHVLKKKSVSSTKRKIMKIADNESTLWAKTFCKAYDCSEWLNAVDSIVIDSSSSIRYYLDESASSCMALYERNSMLGLYCLGTIPERRREGFASSLIDFALDQVNKRQLNFLMLETYGRDDILPFYEKLGFEEIYHKKIYTI